MQLSIFRQKRRNCMSTTLFQAEPSHFLGLETTCTVSRFRRLLIPSVTSRKAAYRAPWLFPLGLLQPPCHLVIFLEGDEVLTLFNVGFWEIRGQVLLQPYVTLISTSPGSLKRKRVWGTDEADRYWCCFACVVCLPASGLLGTSLFPLLEPVKCLALPCLVAGSASYLPDSLS